MRARALTTLAALLSLLSGCNEGSPASPAFESVEGGELDASVTTDAPVEAAYAVCAPGIDASFGSIYSLLLSTPSPQTGCGTASNLATCHSTAAAFGNQGVGNHLDFSVDAGSVYVELLGPDGGGQYATDIDYLGTKILRVAPFDAGASMLYVKLTLDSGNEAPYGSGMPLNDPGSVCPETVAAVQAWINGGAPQN